MNFLAHLFLSGNSENVIAGNFAGDFVKGRLTAEKAVDWPEGYLLGLRLHRFIDELTDHHPVVKDTMRVVSKEYGRVSGIILDIYFDYFLAYDFEHFSGEKLEKYAVRMYALLERRRSQLPVQMLPMMDAMVRQDWLTTYETLEGIDLTFSRLSRRAAFLSPIISAGTLLRENESYFRTQFNLFFPDLQIASARFVASGG